MVGCVLSQLKLSEYSSSGFYPILSLKVEGVAGN